MPDELRIRSDPEVIMEHVGGEMVLVHLGTNMIYSLNATGARVWELLEAGYDESAIKRQLAREFEVDPSALEREVKGLLASLRAQRLVLSLPR